MDPQERDLVKRYLNGYRILAEVNGRTFDVLYSSRFDGDKLPWIATVDPSLRFITNRVHAHIVTCICGDEVGPGIKARRDFPIMDRCEKCAVAELAGDMVQIEKGTMK